jgi:hypothetical protein
MKQKANDLIEVDETGLKREIEIDGKNRGVSVRSK